jgi:hypothetical protein
MQQCTRISLFAEKTTHALQFCSETLAVDNVKCGTGAESSVESCQIIRGTHVQLNAELTALFYKMEK